ncbi:MAG: glycoside hydrolase family 3 protein [Streptosporangiales bacterium]
MGTLDERVAQTLGELTLEEKVGQLFVTYVYGQDAERSTPANAARNRDSFGAEAPGDIVRRYGVGGVIYFGWSDNLGTPVQIARLSNGLQRAAVEDSRTGIPLLVSVDQEQGAVVRLGPPFTELPGNMALGATRRAKDAYRAAVVTGRELRAVGINHDHAPDVDVAVNPHNPVIGVRSYGSDPRLVSRLAVAQLSGYADGGVIATAKHFPGHGDTETDSHVGVPVISHTRAEWERIDAPPFRAVIEAGADTVMTAHIVVPALDPSGDPATLSAPILTGILREELGFDGVICTDSLRMQGVRMRERDEQIPVRALLAGADQLLMPEDLELAWNAVLDAVRAGKLSEQRIDESVARVLRLKYAHGLFEQPYVDETEVIKSVGTGRHTRSADRISDRGVTLVRDDAGAVPVAGDERVVVTGGADAGSYVLAGELEGRGRSAHVVRADATAPDRAAAAAEQAGERGLVVVLHGRNADGGSGAEEAVVRGLVERGSRVAVVAVRDPADLAAVDAPTMLLTYNDSAVSMRALARVLVGEVQPRGRLPVAVPAAGEGEMFGYGHGLNGTATRQGH